MATIKIKRFVGRDNDFIKTSDGRLVSPMVLLDFIINNGFYFNFKKFRFFQNTSKTVTLETVVNNKFYRKEAGEILTNFKYVCPDIALELSEVRGFSMENSGKSRIVICNI
jgi:hypothetical protein